MAENEATPKVGRIRDTGRGAHPRLRRQVFQQAGKAGLRAQWSKGHVKPGSLTRGMGTGVRAAAGLISPGSRRVIVKARYTRIARGDLGAARAHLKYIPRDGVTREGDAGWLYNANQDDVDGGTFLDLAAGDPHQFRFMVSAEDRASATSAPSWTGSPLTTSTTEIRSDLMASCHAVVIEFDYSTIMEMNLTRAAAGFAALSQETRLALLRALAAAGTSGMSAGELAACLKQAPSTLSFHFAALEQAGLVSSQREGRHIVYAIRVAGLRNLFGFLTETCCGGRPDFYDEMIRLLPDDKPTERTMAPAFNVLFLCTRNSARSIMAEAILENISRGKFRAYSAGSKPAPAAMPDVLARLASMGHDVAAFRPKSWHAFTGPGAPRMDFVITLCDPQDGEVCPDLGQCPITAVWPFPDPAKFKGSEAERATLVFELYGMIRRRLEAFVSLPFHSLDRMALKARLDELSGSARPHLVRT